MEAVAWSAVGLLAASMFGSLYYLGSRIDALGGRLDGRIDALSGRIDSLESSLSGRIDALSARMDTHLDRHAS